MFGQILTGDETILVMDSRQAELSRSIDRAVLGRRIRNGRIAAGLTQGQLAQTVGVTTAYISRIEAGQRRPEALRLEAMARAINLDLDDLIEVDRFSRADARIRLTLDRARLALDLGTVDEAQGLLDEARQGLGEATGRSAGWWQVDFIEGLIAEALGDFSRAISVFESVVGHLDQGAELVEVLLPLGRCYLAAGDSAKSFAAAGRATAVLDGLGLADSAEAAAAALLLADVAEAQGKIDDAARACAQPFVAETLSPVGLVRAYLDASSAETARGNSESASVLASKAIRLMDAANGRRDSARLRTRLARLQLEANPPKVEEASRNLDLATRDLEGSSATPADVASNRLLAARALQMAGSVDAAICAVDAVISDALDLAPMAAIEALVCKGRWLAEAGNSDAARSALQQAAEVAASAGAERDVAQVWFELGELLAKSGDAAGSGDAFRRAAAALGASTRGVAPVPATVGPATTVR